VITSYGLLHRGAGMDGQDIALDTTLLVDVDGREQPNAPRRPNPRRNFNAYPRNGGARPKFEVVNNQGEGAPWPSKHR